MEIMIYVAIIAIVATAFTDILISVTRIQNREDSSREVNQQLNFVFDVIQRLVRGSSYVDISAGTPVNSLKLRTEDPVKDPTIISTNNGLIYLQEGASPAIALTSNSVIVDHLSFVKISTFPGHDSVQIDLTLKYNTQNPQQQFSKSLTAAVARASAAAFDADLVPGTDNAYKIGLSSARWQDLNIAGEAKIGGISGDGNGKTVCIRSDGNLGTCSNQPNSSGVCTCN